MRRRDLVTFAGSAAIGWPISARGQSDRTRLIGVLMSFAADDLQGQAQLTAFEEALLHLGWVKGRNARIEVRWGGESADLMRKFAMVAGSLSDACGDRLGPPWANCVCCYDALP